MVTLLKIYERVFGAAGVFARRGYKNSLVFLKRLYQKPSLKPEKGFWKRLPFDKGLCLFVVMGLALFAFDPPLALSMANLPPISHDVFGFVTQFGASHWYIVPAGLGLVFFALRDWQAMSLKEQVFARRVTEWAAAFFIAVAGSGLLVNLLKRLIGRARPQHVTQPGAIEFDPFAFSSGFASFPSGHATTVGAVLFFIIMFCPRFKYFWLSLGALIAYSRVVVGAHFLSDILVGLAFGAGFAWMTCHFFASRRLGFRIKGAELSLKKPYRKEIFEDKTS